MNQWRELRVATMASNADVWMAKKGDKSEKKTRKESENMKKEEGEKKTNKDEKRGWHPNTLSSVFSCRLNTQTHEVEVLGTLRSQTLCVCFGNQSQQRGGKVKTQSKHTQCVWLLGLVL